jgi:hypothetical protein
MVRSVFQSKAQTKRPHSRLCGLGWGLPVALNRRGLRVNVMSVTTQMHETDYAHSVPAAIGVDLDVDAAQQAEDVMLLSHPRQSIIRLLAS